MFERLALTTRRLARLSTCICSVLYHILPLHLSRSWPIYDVLPSVRCWWLGAMHTLAKTCLSEMSWREQDSEEIQAVSLQRTTPARTSTFHHWSFGAIEMWGNIMTDSRPHSQLRKLVCGIYCIIFVWWKNVNYRFSCCIEIQNTKYLTFRLFLILIRFSFHRLLFGNHHFPI